MKKFWFLFPLFFAASNSIAASNWKFTYRPVVAQYAVYGNSLGDPIAPIKDDKKIAFEIQGQAARDIFELIGPDKKDLCSSATQTRFRSRDDDKLSCLKKSKDQYICYFGFDLKSGKSIEGSSAKCPTSAQANALYVAPLSPR